MTNTNKNKSDDSDSSDSEDENLTIVINNEGQKTPNDKGKQSHNDNSNQLPNDDSNKKDDSKQKKDKEEKERKRKRKVRFEEEQRKNKSRKKNNPKKIPQQPIIISFFDLINEANNQDWEEENHSSKPRYPQDNYYPENQYDSQMEDILEEPKEVQYLDVPLENIDDLIKIGNDYIAGLYSPLIKYNLNVYKISKLIEPLKNLKTMIGMHNIKRDVFELLLYQLQEFDNSKDMLHTIIEGEPGVGKTDLAKILAQIYQGMGYCYNDIVKFVKRSDLIGGYLGQTAIKTQKVLDECQGGILVIDEAYSLGSPEGRDSYSKECIDTLTRFLSESPETIVFIMGYKDDLEQSLFAHNKGLERRFSYRFSVQKYTAEELRLILFKIIKQNKWFIENESEIPVSFFEKNLVYFPFNGGDMLNLFTKCKFTHSIRFYNKNRKSTPENNFEDSKKKINYEDLQNAFKLLKKDEKFKNRKNNNSYDKSNLYMYS